MLFGTLLPIPSVDGRTASFKETAKNVRIPGLERPAVRAFPITGYSDAVIRALLSFWPHAQALFIFDTDRYQEYDLVTYYRKLKNAREKKCGFSYNGIVTDSHLPEEGFDGYLLDMRPLDRRVKAVAFPDAYFDFLEEKCPIEACLPMAEDLPAEKKEAVRKYLKKDIRHFEAVQEDYAASVTGMPESERFKEEFRRRCEQTCFVDAFLPVVIAHVLELDDPISYIFSVSRYADERITKFADWMKNNCTRERYEEIRSETLSHVIDDESILRWTSERVLGA